jgi:hypothetical protein
MMAISAYPQPWQLVALQVDWVVNRRVIWYDKPEEMHPLSVWIVLV